MTTFGVGMTLPVMEPDIGPERLQEWSELIDAGPFSSLCFGERIAFSVVVRAPRPRLASQFRLFRQHARFGA